jgi:hypothetical protein
MSAAEYAYSSSLWEFEKKNLDGSTRMTAMGKSPEFDAQSVDSNIQR